ncbi:unnamed protein product [Gongylonema pulchrum]|uniref:Reverse transcriptase domain-containing protein n=1 Tax=Gongylonema pulchrum TaxID=637853 RepID=A0A183EWT8_9BILA|nr:unnamed protein product [Gongylonema pulchrum]
MAHPDNPSNPDKTGNDGSTNADDRDPEPIVAECNAEKDVADRNPEQDAARDNTEKDIACRNPKQNMNSVVASVSETGNFNVVDKEIEEFIRREKGVNETTTMARAEQLALAISYCRKNLRRTSLTGVNYHSCNFFRITKASPDLLS